MRQAKIGLYGGLAWLALVAGCGGELLETPTPVASDSRTGGPAGGTGSAVAAPSTSVVSGAVPDGAAFQLVSLGAGEILLTSMDRDGTKDGYDLELTRAVVEAVNVPVIAMAGPARWTTWSR